MYEFIGKLMGLALRTKNSLNLNLPPVIWKILIRDKITEADIESIDVTAFNLVKDMENYEMELGFDKKRVTEESRKAAFERRFAAVYFEVSNSAGTPQILGGDKRRKITWENHNEYRTALFEYKKSEFDVQLDAMRSGISCVVPFALLGMFTWEEIEREVCGERRMNLELLKKMTKYEHCFATDQHIKYFWQMLQDFSDAERALWLKFVWGRSRLPVRAADFEERFCIQILRAAEDSPNPDGYLPIAHTCFFSLQLPRFGFF